MSQSLHSLFFGFFAGPLKPFGIIIAATAAFNCSVHLRRGHWRFWRRCVAHYFMVKWAGVMGLFLFSILFLLCPVIPPPTPPKLALLIRDPHLPRGKHLPPIDHYPPPPPPPSNEESTPPPCITTPPPPHTHTHIHKLQCGRNIRP